MPELNGSVPSLSPGMMAVSLPALPARGGRRALLAALLLAVFMGALDASMLSLAFRELIDDLASRTAVVVWVALGHLIAAAAPMLLMARVGDAIGHGRSFQIGVALYGVMTVLCGTAPDIGTLIALRVLQGFGLAMFVPSAIFLGTAACPPAQHGRALGTLAAGGAAGLILGAPLAGWLLDVYGWRAIFLARLPLAILAVLLALWVIRREPLADRPRLPGLRDLRDALRLVPDRQGRGFIEASLASIAMFASLPACFFLLPLVMLGGPEVRAWTVGLMLATLALAAALVYPFAGQWSDRLGRERLCVLGAACAGIGYAILMPINLSAPLWQLVLPLVPIGLGIGLFLAPNTSLLVQSVPSHRATLARSFVITLRLGGLALGFALMASLVTLLQERLEYVWDGRAGTVMPPAEAARFEQILQRGGVWSADVLTLVLHAGALLAVTILLIAGIYSIRGRGSRLRRHLLAAAVSMVCAVLALPLLLQRSGVVGTGAAVAARAEVAPSPVAPFGMASRARVELPPRPGTSGRSGAEVFAGICAACHGQDGRGLPPPQGFKIDLTTSRFVAETPDTALAEFIRSGRAIDDPRNTTGMPMPAMRDVIPDDRIDLVVQYLRQLRQ